MRVLLAPFYEGREVGPPGGWLKYSSPNSLSPSYSSINWNFIRNLENKNRLSQRRCVLRVLFSAGEGRGNRRNYCPSQGQPKPE